MSITPHSDTTTTTTCLTISHFREMSMVCYHLRINLDGLGSESVLMKLHCLSFDVLIFYFSTNSLTSMFATIAITGGQLPITIHLDRKLHWVVSYADSVQSSY